MNQTRHANKPGMEQQSTACPRGCQGSPHVPWLTAETEALWLHLSEEGRAGFSVPEGPTELEVGEAVSSFLMCPGTTQEKAHTGMGCGGVCVCVNHRSDLYLLGEQEILQEENATLEIQKRLLGMRQKQKHSFLSLSQGKRNHKETRHCDGRNQEGSRAQSLQNTSDCQGEGSQGGAWRKPWGRDSLCWFIKRISFGQLFAIWIYSHYRISPAKGSYSTFTQSSKKDSTNSPRQPRPVLYLGSWITSPELPGAVLVLG